jgi:hypothetical protein
MKVLIDGQKINLSPKNIIGTGGEATVSRVKDFAVKVYHRHDPRREQKLRDFLAQDYAQKLPVEVIAPQKLVYSEDGKAVIGFAMPLVAQGFEPLAMLANRIWRANHAVTTAQIAAIFGNLHTTLANIHAVGLIVGDLNDQNELFCEDAIAFVDVDSWQFGTYPCMVATEAYCEPRLYGLDLSRQPNFTANDDWYAYAVLVFKSLLGVHPYGGTHPKVKLLPKRAGQRLPVLCPDVIYPKTGLHPNFLSDDLAQVFWQIFADGRRGEFPKNTLTEYAQDLIECKQCKAWYPASRQDCPACFAAKLAFVLPTKRVTGGVTCQTLIKAQGVIVWWRVLGSAVYAIANEENIAVIYIYRQNAPLQRSELFRYRRGMSFALFADAYLAVSPGDASQDLLILELATAKPVTRTTTGLFGDKQAIFGGNRYLYRLAGTMLMRGEIRFGQLVERAILPVSDGQTWLKVSPDNEAVFGYFRSFNYYEYFWQGENGRHTVHLPELEPGESLQAIEVVFDSNSLLVARQTRKNGQDWLRLEVSDLQGNLISQEVRRADDLNLHGLAFANGVLLYATNQGIGREKLPTAKNQPLVMTDTAEYVSEGDQLQPYGNGLLVIGANQIDFLGVG